MTGAMGWVLQVESVDKVRQPATTSSARALPPAHRLEPDMGLDSEVRGCKGLEE